VTGTDTAETISRISLSSVMPGSIDHIGTSRLVGLQAAYRFLHRLGVVSGKRPRSAGQTESEPERSAASLGAEKPAQRLVGRVEPAVSLVLVLD
jgi:hypothetical protein